VALPVIEPFSGSVRKVQQNADERAVMVCG
jgi:hypothetical protein